MGNNAAFTCFEATVIATYDKGVLDRELLSSFMEQYRGCDIDSGGMVGNLSRDGHDVVSIVIRTFGETDPPRPALPDDWKLWSDDMHELNDNWQDERWGKFHSITDKFGWR